MNAILQLPNIKENVPIGPLTTMKVGGPGRYVVMVESAQALSEAVTAAIQDRVPYVMLGSGSNVLVSDQGFDGLVIRATGGNHAISGTRLSADATCVLAAVARVAYQHGLSGLEWGAGVPGTIGGAVRGNAGNFLGDMRSIAYAIDYLDERGEEHRMSAQECVFSYRHSVFKHHPAWIILRCHMELSRAMIDDIKERMDKIVDYKRETQNTPYPTSGCMFKNILMQTPEDRANAELHGIADLIRYSDDIGMDVIPVRVLLERLNITGLTVGGAAVSEKNANFLINKEKATAEEMMMLVGIIKQKIHDAFGIRLVEEFQYIGF